MKKYRLKEEAKRFLTDKLNVQIGEVIQTLEDWEKVNFCIEALEEVEEKIELEFYDDCAISKKDTGEGVADITDQEKELCEKALNGELFTKDDMEAFVNYSRRVDNINSPTNMLIKDFLRMNNDDY